MYQLLKIFYSWLTTNEKQLVIKIPTVVTKNSNQKKKINIALKPE